MTIKNSLTSLLVLTLVTLSATARTAPTSFKDRELHSSDGKKWIVRSAKLSDFNGGQVAVEIRLFEDGKGGLVYQFDEQTESTKIYHQASCEAINAEASHGDITLHGETAAAWSCASEVSSSEDDTAALRHKPPRASFYVYALARSGSAPLGVNFNSVGSARYKSSIAGESSATLSIDNGRCMAFKNDHHAGPFEGDYILQVACIGTLPGLLNTTMTACIPRFCSPDRGAINVL